MKKTDPISKEIIRYFKGIEQEKEFLKKIGIYQDYKNDITKIKEGYLVPLENSIFKIKTTEKLNFEEIIGVIAMETLGDNWIKKGGEKEAKDRNEIYQIISILGATDTFKKIISYTDDKIKSPSIPNSGFSKNFTTLSFDIFCLRRGNFLPKELVERLKNFNEYQGARYEIAVAAIFCRLGYDIKWFDNKKTRLKHPEFSAEKDDFKIYVEAKSRQINGIHNTKGSFNEKKAFKSTGWGGLVNKALQKNIPSKKPYIVFIDMNAVNDGGIPPNWIKDIRKTLKGQHLKKYSNKKAPFTSIIFTNYAYHYQGLNSADEGVCFSYENDMTERPYSGIQEKIDLWSATKHYGFVPDYYIPQTRPIIRISDEYPRIRNIPEFY